MTKAEFAKQVRQSMREGKELSLRLLALLDRVDDNFIFDTYLNMRCKDCGGKLAEGLDVEQILAESRDEGDFFGRCVAAMGHDHAFVRYDWPEEIDV
jgi:hypothetical protein